MGPLALMLIYTLISGVLLIGAFAIGLVAEKTVPAYSAIVFLFACGVALWVAWPIALRVTASKAVTEEKNRMQP